MKPVPTVYLICFAIVCVLSLVASLPVVASLLVVATFGIGLLLLPIPVTAAVWMALGLPFALSFQVGRPWAVAVGAAISLALVAWVLFLPAMTGRAQLDREIAEMTAGDVVGRLGPEPLGGVEIRAAWPGREVPVCDALCTGLLVDGQAAWVRMVVPVEGDGDLRSQLFVAGVGELCGAESRCPVVAADPGARADLEIDVSPLGDVEERDARLDARVARLEEAERLTILDTRRGEELYRETRIASERATMPMFWVPRFLGLEMRGFEVFRRGVKPQPTPIVAALGEIGLTVEPREAPRRDDEKDFTKLPTSAETSAVVALLDRPADQAFAPSDEDVIRDYIAKVRWYPDDEMPDLHRDIVVRIFQETRFEAPSYLDQLLPDDATLRARVLPWMMDAFEAGAPMPDRTRLALLAALRKVYRPSDLAPYRDRYGRILAALPPGASELWYAPVGRFGSDPRPLLEASGRTGEERLKIVVLAFCNSAKQWEASLAEMLWRDLEADPGIIENRTVRSWPVSDALKVVQWAGRGDDLDRWLPSLGLSEANMDYVGRMLDRTGPGKHKQTAC